MTDKTVRPLDPHITEPGYVDPAPPTNDEIRAEYHVATEAVDNAAPGDRSAALDRAERAYDAWVRRGRP